MYYCDGNGRYKVTHTTSDKKIPCESCRFQKIRGQSIPNFGSTYFLLLFSIFYSCYNFLLSFFILKSILFIQHTISHPFNSVLFLFLVTIVHFCLNKAFHLAVLLIQCYTYPLGNAYINITR